MWRRLRGAAILAGELLIGGIAGVSVYAGILASVSDPLTPVQRQRAVLAAVLSGLLATLGARAGGYRLWQRRERPSSEASAVESEPVLTSNLAPRNPNFTGRARLLAELHDKLTDRSASAEVRTQVIHGLGGVGKSQLAIEYAHRYADDYQLVWWVSAEQPAALVAGLVALARRLGVTESADVTEVILGLWDALRRRDRWLLIFDNVEKQEDLLSYRPLAGDGEVLITSRSPAWRGIAGTIKLDVLDRAESVAFLRRRLGADHPPAIEALAEQVGDLPLALEQAAAYMDETQTTPPVYLGLLQQRATALLGRGTPTNYDKRVATTWEISLGRIRATVPAAVGLLNLCAFLAADDIPYELPTAHPEAVPEPLRTAAADQLSYRDAVGALAQYSLVNASPNALSLHRLVQAVVRDQLQPAEQSTWAAAAVRLVSASLPTISEDATNWPAWQRLVPHAVIASEHARRLGSAPKETAYMLDSVGGYLRERGQLAQARSAFELVLAVDQEAHGPSHHTVAIDRNNLGSVIQALGDLEDARWQLEQGLAVAETTCGPEHRLVATIRNTLGRVLQNIGQWEAARAELERSLSITEAAYGPGHPAIGAVCNTLGGVLQDLGDLAGARRQLERALEITEAVYGAEHPTVSAVRGNLGRVLQDLADWEGARAELDRALAIDERFYGPDHLSLAVDHNNLGCLFLDMDDFETAHAEFERAIAIDEAAYGQHHPALGSVATTSVPRCIASATCGQRWTSTSRRSTSSRRRTGRGTPRWPSSISTSQAPSSTWVSWTRHAPATSRPSRSTPRHSVWSTLGPREVASYWPR